MIQDTINNFILNCKFIESNKQVKKIDYQISQHELINTIHQEFQKTFIQKLYPQSKWINRIFWNVAGVLQQKYYDELSLDQITTTIKRYLSDHKMIIPQTHEMELKYKERFLVHSGDATTTYPFDYTI